MDPKSDCGAVVLIRYNDLPARPWPYREDIENRIDWAVRRYENQTEAMEWLDDDTLPYIAPYTGTEIFAEALGCKVHYSGDNMPFALPLIKEAAEIKNIRQPKIEDCCLYEIFELAYKLRGRAGENALIQLPDVQSPLDIAALVWRKEQFLMAMLDEPGAVNELTAITEGLLTDFLDRWFHEFGNKYIAHYPDFYMEGGFTFSEDEVGEFSSDLFRQFCLPVINRMSDRYGGCAMHCCANSKHQWEGFKEIRGLRLLNLVQPMDLLAEAVRFFGADVCHWHGAVNQEERLLSLPEWVKSRPPRTHVVLEASAATTAEAIELCSCLKGLGN